MYKKELFTSGISSLKLLFHTRPSNVDLCPQELKTVKNVQPNITYHTYPRGFNATGGVYKLERNWLTEETQEMKKVKTCQIISAILLNVRTCSWQYLSSAANVLSAAVPKLPGEELFLPSLGATLLTLLSSFPYSQVKLSTAKNTTSYTEGATLNFFASFSYTSNTPWLL